MITEYMAMDGKEVYNNARTTAYARRLGAQIKDCYCPELAAQTGPFTTPEADGAPWWDPADPAADEFAGVLVVDAVGLGAGVDRGSIVALPSGYGTVAPVLPRVRELAFTGTLVASSRRGLDYGIAWLTSVLSAEPCTPLCLGSTLSFFAACSTPLGGRVVYDAVLMDPPKITEKWSTRGACAGGSLWYGRVEWGISTANPYIYRPTGEPATEVFSTDAETGCEVVWHEAGDCPPPIDCDPAGVCLVDPACPPAPKPPVIPQPGDACGCTTRFVSASAVLQVGSTDVPEWMDQVPVVIVDAGAAVMRRLSLRFYPMIEGQTCADTVADPCGMCAEINVSYLPAQAVLTVDGRSRTATVDCIEGIQSADAILRGTGGRIFDWPAIAGTSMCVQALVDADHYAPDASVTVMMAGRQEAG